MDNLNEYIINILRKTISIDLKSPEEAEKIITQMNYKSNNGTIGVLSVLKRIKNLLDYLISMNSEMLLDQSLNYEHFRPVTEQSDMYNPIIINKSYIYPNRTPITKEDDIFRKNLIEILRYQLQKIRELNLINVTMINCTISGPITNHDFNNIIHLCNNKKIDDTKNENYENYKKISYYLGLNFKNKLDNLSQSQLSKNNKEFVNAFNLLIYPAIAETVEQNMNGWHASCRKKYLKYKMKYLKLKKNS